MSIDSTKQVRVLVLGLAPEEVLECRRLARHVGFARTRVGGDRRIVYHAPWIWVMVAGVCAVETADVTAITQTRTSPTEARRRAFIVVIPLVVQTAT
jgi:hypothetical protein